MRVAALLAGMGLVAACSSSPATGSSSRQPTPADELIAAVREAEALVVGEVFTELMTNNRLVDATLALCDLQNRVGPDVAKQETDGLLRSLDWNAPANPAMLRLMLEVGRITVCTETGTIERSLAEILPARRQIGPGATGADVDASVAAFFDTADGMQFIATIRDHQATLGDVFTKSMTDEELASLARGICWTWSELGSGAEAELRSHQEIYGWTGEADAAMFDLLLDVADVVCITVGG